MNIEPIPAEARDTSRRSWLSHVGLLAGGVVVAGVTKTALAQNTPMGGATAAGNSVVPDTSSNPNNPATVVPKAADQATASDIDILNFALGLEYLEADFYRRVVEAHTARPYLTPRVFEVAQKLAADEDAHVKAILEILQKSGSTPVARGNFQFPSKVFYSMLDFLDLAQTFEVTGTGAYLGAAPMVKSRDTLRFAASVYGIEARHTGLIRFLNGKAFAPSEVEEPLTMEEVMARVRPYIVS